MIHLIPRFLRRLFNDTRGEDLTEKSSGLSNAGKAVIAAATIAAAAGGATALANNANSASDTTSKNINGAVGAQVQQSDKLTSPFKVQ
jgi:hypothetical protein